MNLLLLLLVAAPACFAAQHGVVTSAVLPKAGPIAVSPAIGSAAAAAETAPQAVSGAAESAAQAAAALAAQPDAQSPAVADEAAQSAGGRFDGLKAQDNAAGIDVAAPISIAARSPLAAADPSGPQDKRSQAIERALTNAPVHTAYALGATAGSGVAVGAVVALALSQPAVVPAAAFAVGAYVIGFGLQMAGQWLTSTARNDMIAASDPASAALAARKADRAFWLNAAAAALAAVAPAALALQAASAAVAAGVAGFGVLLAVVSWRRSAAARADIKAIGDAR